MAINWGGYQFTDPVPLSTWYPPYRAGLYAIMKPDATWSPVPAAPLYFGQSENMADRGFATHHKRLAWETCAGGPAALYVSTLPMPNSTEEQRCAIESALVAHYRPPCNG